MADNIIINGPTSTSGVIINQPIIEQPQVAAFSIVKGDKGETGPPGPSALDLFRIQTGNPLATLEDYQAYLIKEPKTEIALAVADLETKVATGYFTPVIEPNPETKSWWVNGVDTNYPYAVTVEGSIDPQTFTHEQNIPSSVWIIDHPMNKYPAVSITDSAGTEVIGDITYESNSRIRIEFNAAFSGKATLN